MSTRKGKIARLPARIREELNAKLLDGLPASRILPWLNNLPEVLSLGEEDAEGICVNDQNLSAWRNGGFKDWLRRREGIDRTREMSQWAVKLAQASGGNLTEGAAAILSGRILEVLERIDEVLGDAPENETPEEKKKRFVLIADTIESCTDAIASLRSGDQNNVRLKQNDKKLEILTERLKQTEKQLELEVEKVVRQSAKFYLGLRAKEREELNAIADSSLSNEEKLEQLGQKLFPLHWKKKE